MMHKGYDTFCPENADTFPINKCLVCGELLTVTKGHNGPTEMAEAMSGHGHKHDLMTCPNNDTDWHEQAFGLIRFIENTPSKVLAGLVEAERKQVVKKKKCTKKYTLI